MKKIDEDMDFAMRHSIQSPPADTLDAIAGLLSEKDRALRLPIVRAITRNETLEDSTFLEKLKVYFAKEDLMPVFGHVRRPDFQFFLKVFKAGGTMEVPRLSDACFVLLQYCYCIQMFYDRQRFVAVIPQEVRKAYQTHADDKVVQSLLYLYDLRECAQACANMYGILPIKDFCNILDTCLNIKLGVETALNVIHTEKNLDNFIIDEGCIVHHALLVEGDVKPISKFRKLILERDDYYLPSRTELMAYRDTLYGRWTPLMAAFQTCVRDLMSGSEEDVRTLVETVLDMAVMGTSEKVIFQVLMSRGVHSSSDEIQGALEDMVYELCETLPSWILRGYSYVEAFPPETDEYDALDDGIEADTKVGRNDPCTCGSGKKYKKCCGKLS